MAVEDGEEVEVRVALELRLDGEGVLVLALGGGRVVPALAEGGVPEEETVGGDDGGVQGAAGEEVPAVADVAVTEGAGGGARGRGLVPEEQLEEAKPALALETVHDTASLSGLRCSLFLFTRTNTCACVEVGHLGSLKVFGCTVVGGWPK